MVRTRAIVVTLTALTLALAVAVAPRPSQAQYGGGMGGMMGGGGPYPSFEKVMDYPVKTETNGGSATGTIRMGSIQLNCDLGFYTIALKQVKEVRFSRPTVPVDVNYGQIPVEVPAVVVTGSALH